MGKSGTYAITQITRPTADGFEVEFKHDFDDATIMQAHFTMLWLESGLFRGEISGASTDRAFVEVSYRTSGDGLDVFGSSSRNAEGQFIAWRETLRRR